MLRIPVDILKQYDTVLKNRAVPFYLRADYTKWLRYYLDFRGKYPLPDSRSEHVRLFIKKLREKNQSQKQQDQAAHALSLFFASEQQKTHDSSSQDQASLPAYSPQATTPHPNREPEAESAVSQREGASITRDGKQSLSERLHLPSESPATRSGTLSRRIFCKPITTSARSRYFWATATSGPR